jgi:hypothetical protein
MKNDTTSAKRDALYMDNGGRIECGAHAPHRGTDSWVWREWQAITPRQALAFERDVGRPPACESCTAIALRAAGK